jgi:hypothetical protein
VRLFCGRRALPSCAPAYLRSWWCRPRVTSFAAICSGYPNILPNVRVNANSMLTGNWMW